MATFGWMLLSATAMTAWLSAFTVFRWWGLVAGFVIGGCFCFGMAWQEAQRVASDPSWSMPRCGTCGTAVLGDHGLCRRCGGVAAIPGAAGGGAKNSDTVVVSGGSMAAMLSRATGPVMTQLADNYTWRNWAGVLLIFAGISGALGAMSFGPLQPIIVLILGAGAGLAILRWRPITG